MCSKFALVIIFFFITAPVFAARSLSIVADKVSLAGSENLTITASSLGFTDGETIYIKGAFFQSGSTNYFGYTQSGDTWIKNSTTNTSQRSIIIGQWDGTLKIKSDFDDSGFIGEGDYSLKVAFYYLTSGGNLSSVNWSENVLTVNLNEPDPTPTSTPTPANTPTPTSAPTPTKTPTPTPLRTPTSTKSPIPTIASYSVEMASPESVLGLTDIEETPQASGTSRPLMPIIISLFLIGTGLGILSFVTFWKKWNLLRTP